LSEKYKTFTNFTEFFSIKYLSFRHAPRDATESHHDLNGGDPAISAKAAGHTMLIKYKYYKKGSFEDAQESYGKLHPAFVEGG
jgi:hypothetical protein